MNALGNRVMANVLMSSLGISPDARARAAVAQTLPNRKME